MFENVDRRTDDGVTGILIAHLGAFGSGELKSMQNYPVGKEYSFWGMLCITCVKVEDPGCWHICFGTISCEMAHVSFHFNHVW